MRGLSTKGNLRFKINWASLIVAEGNLPFLFCFTLYLRPISKYKPLGWGGGGLIFFALQVWGGLCLGGLIFGILRYVTVLERYHISLSKPS